MHVVVTTANEFADWLADRPPVGSRCQYHQGMLAIDRTDIDRHELRVLANRAWQSFLDGKVTLTQGRLPDGSMAYFADVIRDGKVRNKEWPNPPESARQVSIAKARSRRASPARAMPAGAAHPPVAPAGMVAGGA